MNKIYKYLMVLFLYAIAVSANAVIIEGQISAGSYIPVKVDSSGIVSTGLPTGASTAAKQPALGTAGSASTDVITVQGIASGTALAVSQSGTWTVQPGNTANTTAWKVDGSAVTQPTSFVSSATGGYSFTNISTSTNTVVKGSAGTLHGVNINSKGTVASAITVYDNTACSGTVIAVIDSLNLAGLFLYDVAASTGICVTTTGTVAPNVTVIYK